MGSHRWFFEKEEFNFFDLPDKYPKEDLVYLTPDSDFVLTNMCKEFF
jgi:hypothetical protein